MLHKTGWLGLALLAAAPQVDAKHADDIRIIVKYKTSQNHNLIPKAVFSHLNGFSLDAMELMAGGAFSVHFKSKQPLQPGKSLLDETEILLKSLRKNPAVLYAVKDRTGHIKPLEQSSEQPYANLLSHDAQWDEFKAPAGIMLESAPGLRDGAWAYTTGESEKPVVVAVLDTGIMPHDHLMNNLLKDKDGNIWGWNFSGNNNNVLDETQGYHGSHVAGTIAGYGAVMSGMGEQLKVLPVKIPDSTGMFYESAVVNGIYWAVGGDVPGVPKNPYPAKVLNMSFGVDKGPHKEIEYCDEALQDALNFARKKGAVVVVAAGNDNRWEHYNAPAICNGTIKVASTGPEGLRAYYSNYGPAVTLAAPGGDLHYGINGGILSTVNPGGGYQGSGFAFYQGTSMASPHVAGVAGLLYAASSKPLSPQIIEQILYTTTHEFGQSKDPNKSCIGNKPCGHGILDAQNAVKAVLSNFDTYLSAPSLKATQAVGCKKGLYSSSLKTLKSGEALWHVQSTACISQEQLQHPVLEQTQDGQILAHYGALTYKLDQASFKHCELIGYDGLGCFR